MTECLCSTFCYYSSVHFTDSSFDTRKQSIVSTVHILNKKIPEDMIIPPSALDVSSVIGQGNFCKNNTTYIGGSRSVPPKPKFLDRALRCLC